MMLPGLILDAYQGRNAHTDVWFGRQDHLNRAVTIKMLRPDLSGYPAEVARFRIEARRASLLKHHHILEVYDFRDQDEQYYLIMEHATGSNVAELLADDPAPMAPRMALAITIPIASALAFAWQQHRLIHRNVSPKCILIDETSQSPKLDFVGLSLQWTPTGLDPAPETDMVEGTPHYMAPEQIQAPASMDDRTDMYGLGATLYHLLTGSAPFAERPTMEVLDAQLADQIPHPCDLVPSLTPELAGVVARLMMKDPAGRYPDWPAAIAALERALRPDRLRFIRESENSPTVAWSTVAQPSRPIDPPPRATDRPAGARRPGTPILVRRATRGTSRS